MGDAVEEDFKTVKIQPKLFGSLGIASPNFHLNSLQGPICKVNITILVINRITSRPCPGSTASANRPKRVM